MSVSPFEPAKKSRRPLGKPNRFVTATLSKHALRAKTRNSSCGCDSAVPLCVSFGSGDPQCGSGNEVALKVEGVVDGGVHAEEAPGRSSRLEPLQLTLASSHRLM